MLHLNISNFLVVLSFYIIYKQESTTLTWKYKETCLGSIYLFICLEFPKYKWAQNAVLETTCSAVWETSFSPLLFFPHLCFSFLPCPPHPTKNPSLPQQPLYTLSVGTDSSVMSIFANISCTGKLHLVEGYWSWGLNNCSEILDLTMLGIILSIL